MKQAYQPGVGPYNHCEPQSSLSAVLCRPESNYSPASFALALQSRNVMMIPFVGDSIRAVTHVNISEEDVHTALEAVKAVLEECPKENGTATKSPYGDW